MDWFSGIVVFLCIWWTALFAVLPWGIRHSKEKEAHIGPGAPENPDIKKKFLMTTLVSAVLWVGVYLAIEANLINFREMAEKMAQSDYTE